MAILDDVKTALRVRTSLTDAEVEVYIATALFDMGNKGVRSSFLAPDGDGEYQPIVKTAIMCYCKANYGYDKEDDAAFALRAYDSIVTSLCNGKQNRRYVFTDMGGCTVADIPDQPYTGDAVTPSVRVMDGETVLVEGDDYTVAYADNTEPGTATITITGAGEFTGEVSKHFTIEDA